MYYLTRIQKNSTFVLNMSDISLIKGEFEEQPDLLIAPEIWAGFPSPADDYEHERLDFNREFTISEARIQRQGGAISLN